MFIAAMSFAGCDTLKCVSMSDQECNLSPAIININSNDILTKTWMSQNEPKPAKTTRNQPKRQKKIGKRPETTQIPKLRKSGIF